MRGKSQKCLALSEKYDIKLCKAKAQFMKKNVDSIMHAKPGQAYKMLKRLGARPEENPEDGAFILPEYERLGLSAADSADRLAQSFADVSQEYPPLVIAHLPGRIQDLIKEGGNQDIPYISRQFV